MMTMNDDIPIARGDAFESELRELMKKHDVVIAQVGPLDVDGLIIGGELVELKELDLPSCQD